MFICKCRFPYIFLSFSCVSQYACLNTGQRCVQDVGPRAEQVWVEKKSTHVLEEQFHFNLMYDCVNYFTFYYFAVTDRAVKQIRKGAQ